MKLTRLASFVLLAPLTLAVPLAAQDPVAKDPTAQALPQAREVIDRFVTVTKIAPLLERTKSMHYKGKLEVAKAGLKGVAETWSAKPNMRFDSVELGAFGKTLNGNDGKVAWMSTDMTGALVLAGNDLLLARLDADYLSMEKPAALYESMRTLGRESFEGKDCYAIELVAKPLEGMDAEKSRAVRTSIEYYEVESGLQLGKKGQWDGQMGKGPFTTIFSEYKEFGGALLATRNVLRQSAIELVVTFDTVEFDTATGAEFVLPKAVQAKLAPAPASSPAPKVEPKPQ